MKNAIITMIGVSGIAAGLLAPLTSFAMPCRDITCYPMPIGTGTGNPGHNK